MRVIFRDDGKSLGDFPFLGFIRDPTSKSLLKENHARKEDQFLYTPSFLINFHLLGLLLVGAKLEAVMHIFRAQ